MPMFTHLFNIKPWEVKYLTVREIQHYLNFLYEYNKSKG